MTEMGAKQRSEPGEFLYVSFSPQAGEKRHLGPTEMWGGVYSLIRERAKTARTAVSGIRARSCYRQSFDALYPKLPVSL
jgi:hypothetical protein